MPPRKATEKPIFKDLIIALAGPLDGQWTDVNIARWVSQRAGRFAAQMDASVTHLVCSEEAFKARGPRVKEALTRPRSCCIVTKDWLEDSITEKRRLNEEGFAVNKAEQEKRRRRKEKKRQDKRQERAEALAVRAVNPYYWHTYRDGTFFRYEVVISRVEGEVERRFELSLYESNASPHLYWFVAKFFKRKGDSRPNYYRPSDSPGLFWREFGLFEHFFEKKTGIPWEKRLVLCTAAARVDDAALANGGKTEEELADGDSRKEIWYKLEDERRSFVYEPPTKGRPVGWAPPEFIPVVVEEAVSVAGEEVKAQAQTRDIMVDVATQVGDADVVMTDAGEDVVVKTDNDEQHTPDTDIKDARVKEEQEEDTEMATDTDNKDASVDEAQEDAIMTTETNTQDSDTSAVEARDATATPADAKTQHPDVEKIQEATAMLMDTKTRDISIDWVQGDAVMTTGAIAQATSVDEEQETVAVVSDLNIVPKLEEIEEAIVMTMDLNTQCPNMEEMQEAPAITNTDAVTKDTNVNVAQEVVAILADVKTEDTSVDGVQEDTAMMSDLTIKDTRIEEIQEDITATIDTNTDNIPSEANASSASDSNVSPSGTWILLL
ncbi:hypothetical protein B0T18DRAFT_451548 [Schizothecium vesticola]|uniref:BRCT domain-containing protein n=1 Tax=Schizothecium vesticola TaxID=314040 RepID=A0AA40KBG7_9PEZI|nr:hypothetical protein B0T18DRAFT_451548 [Schizothecium vesticola]